MGLARYGSGIGIPWRLGRGPRTWIALALLLVALGGCRRAAFALLPRAPMGPQRNGDPFAPLGPPAAARAPEGRAPTVSTAAGKVDVGVSAAALLVNVFGGRGFLFGVYGTFEETKVMAPERDPERKRAASPAAADTAPAVPAPPAPDVAPANAAPGPTNSAAPR